MKPSKPFILALVILAISSCQPGKEKAKPPVRLGADVQQLAEEVLAPMDGPVTIHISRGGKGEVMGEEAQALVDLIGETSPLVSVNRVDIMTGSVMSALGVSKGPVIEMRGRAPGTLRYYGFPERKEMRPFLEGILSASGYPAYLAPEVKSYISALDEEILIRIFTTPD